MNKKNYIIPFIILIISLIGITYSSYNLFIWKRNVLKNNDIKEITYKYVNIKNDEYKIDFKSLKNINDDIIAYLIVNDTDINYAVVKGEDNEYYLNHNLNKEYNNAGWIYSDFRNNFDNIDTNIIIYGHNMKDGSMFGSLNKIFSNDWQENKDNLIINLITEDKTYKYQVFSTYLIEPVDDYLKIDFKDNDEYLKFLNTIKTRSNYDYNLDINSNDKILTLSTCSNDGKKRIVLHSKLIN